jgi:hypothetical protein
MYASEEKYSFGDHPPPPRPAFLSAIRELAEHPRRLSRAPVLLLGLLHCAANDPSQTLVARETEYIMHIAAVEKVPPEQTEKIDRHRSFLLDLCVRCGATAAVARKHVDQWKVSLIPENAFVPPDPGVETAPHTHTRLPRCLACGRDADPQNMLDLKLHYYEKDKVFKILREAGMEVYD